MNMYRAVVVLAWLSLSACSTAPGPVRSVQLAKTFALIETAVGEQVGHFRFGHLVTADALDDRQLAVRVWPRRLWLLTVEDGCGMTRATSQFRVTSSLKNVTVNRDRVLFASPEFHGACRIRQIRPINLDEVAESGG